MNSSLSITWHNEGDHTYARARTHTHTHTHTHTETDTHGQTHTDRHRDTLFETASDSEALLSCNMKTRSSEETEKGKHQSRTSLSPLVRIFTGQGLGKTLQ